MPHTLQGRLSRSLPLRYVFAASVFALALALRLWWLPLESRLTFPTFYPGVVVVFYLAGLGPGLLYVVLSVLAGLYVFTPPAFTWAVDQESLVAETGFLLTAAMIAWTVGRMRRASRKLNDANDRLRDLYDNAPCAYYSIDAEGRFLEINDMGLRWLGCSREELIEGGRHIRDFLSPESRVRFDAHFPVFKRIGRIGPLEFDLVGCDGSERRVSVMATAVRDADGRFLRSRSVMYDITEMARVRRELQRANREQALMLDNELVGIVKLKDRHIVWKNRALDRMFGYEPGELMGQSSRAVYFDDVAHEEMGRRAYERIASGERFREQVLMKRKDGSPIWVDVSGVALSPESGETLWMFLDVTTMRRYQEQVERMASHDALTGLPNRTLLMDRLRQAVAASDRHHDLMAVCFMDLDGFKAVNDEHGHAAGDELLAQVGPRLHGVVRTNDTVARVGGDEFVMVLTQLHDRHECDAVLRRVHEVIGLPFQLSGGLQVHVGGSIGVAFFPGDGDGAEGLIARADQAMYRAKHEGRNQVRYVSEAVRPDGPQSPWHGGIGRPH